ncbi:MAG: alpha-1,2-fucosyltransferase [Sphingomonadaceae bacterium]|nr:alpha-1,2-fucosyltransferase [Sphingomonadaceae bacterium]
MELQNFSVNLRVASIAEQRKWRPYRTRLGQLLQPLLPLRLFRETGFGVNQSVLNAPSSSYLFGFWQGEAYFKDIRSTLLSELVPLSEPSAADLQILEAISRDNSVSVHVRRGDYVTLQSASAYHGTCSPEYYRNALKYIESRVSKPVFFVFSDDPDWTSRNLHFPHTTHYVKHNDATTAFQDLRLMSKCNHHIIANSSFSWWGAWLANKLDGLTIAPDIWFAGGRPTPDLLPADWVRI